MALLGDLLGHSEYSVEDGLKAFDNYLQVAESEEQLREEEFRALLGPHESPDLGPPAPYFQARDGVVPPGFAEVISHVALVDRLREVSAVWGLTRLSARDEDSTGSDVQVAKITRGRPTWLPAVENFGEGIFLAFDRALLDQQGDRADKRVRLIQHSYDAWRAQRKLPRSETRLTPRFVALHSLAHLLMRQLSLYCGYGMASISERVYADNEQAGILIYTSAPDSDGSLGGLVSFGSPDRLGTILESAVVNAEWCSQDPLCGDRTPDPGIHLSGAACHACLLLPETSCEHWNRFLDRRLLRAPDGAGLLDRP
jgi:hypothetical protein